MVQTVTPLVQNSKIVNRRDYTCEHRWMMEMDRKIVKYADNSSRAAIYCYQDERKATI